jgi:NAD(P)-dependent dehydrogenase (short-subunit alcohol dehydrogenase family)
VRLAADGARLALLDLNRAAVEATARRCREAGAQVRADIVDVTDQDSLALCAAPVADEFRRVDLLGAMGTVHAFLPLVRASDAGNVVLFSSGFGLLAMPGFAAYSASKFGVRGFTEALAQELSMDGRRVRVTCVYPGVVRTPIMRRGTFGDGEDRPRERAALTGWRERNRRRRHGSSSAGSGGVGHGRWWARTPGPPCSLSGHWAAPTSVLSPGSPGSPAAASHTGGPVLLRGDHPQVPGRRGQADAAMPPLLPLTPSPHVHVGGRAIHVRYAPASHGH